MGVTIERLRPQDSDTLFHWVNDPAVISQTSAVFRPTPRPDHDAWFARALDAEGVLTLVGRSKDLVISGGFNVYPAEVEGRINELPGVAESAVVGVPHPDFGEAVVAVVVPRPGAAPEPAAIIAALRDTIAHFKVPKHVRLADALPRNAMGKVQKKLLREEMAGLFG